MAAAADAAFGSDLYQVLAEDAADTIFSPASVAAALRLAWCGARGQTADELARALHLNGALRPEDVAVSGLSLVAAGQVAAAGRESASGAAGASGGADGPATFRAPDSVWVQSGLPLRPEFTARLSQAAATLADADFAAAPEAARTEINRVIAAQTAGKITGLLPPGTIGAMTRLVLANAVYLKAAWTQPFPEQATAEAPFYPDAPGGPGRADGPALTVPMMRGTAARQYLRGDGYQAVLLPYRDLSLAMAVVLPAGLGGLLAGTARHQVALSLPRFRLEAAFNLIPALRRLGVTRAFGGEADFTGITDAEPLQIGAVAHKAYVDVDEHGTEAAAATAIAFRPLAATRPPPPVTMVVDRPFLIAIVDMATSLPLFLGQVTRPGTG